MYTCTYLSACLLNYDGNSLESATFLKNLPSLEPTCEHNLTFVVLRSYVLGMGRSCDCIREELQKGNIYEVPLNKDVMLIVGGRYCNEHGRIRFTLWYLSLEGLPSSSRGHRRCPIIQRHWRLGSLTGDQVSSRIQATAPRTLVIHLNVFQSSSNGHRSLPRAAAGHC